MTNSLYIHIPFCNNICGYCDFCKVLYEKGLADRYIDLIKRDIVGFDPFETIYIGGGSPSSLSVEQMVNLFESLKYRIDENTEFTIEVNPEDMNKEKIQLFALYKVNRVSIGVQSFDEGLLKLMGRKHTEDDVVRTVKFLQSFGITNINCDLIYGFPGQTKKMIKEDIKKLLKLNVKHISTYALQLEDHTFFKNNGIEPVDDDTLASMYHMISRILKRHKFNRYEVSNFALKGYESKHNLVYWHGLEYQGLGIGASGYENGIRYDNSKSLTKFLYYQDLRDETIIEDEDKEYEYIILNLRLKDGFSLKEFEHKFGVSFLNKYAKEVEELKKNKMVKVTKDRFFVRPNKVYILNRVLQYFVKD